VSKKETTDNEKDFLSVLSGEEALNVLYTLVKRDPVLAAVVMQHVQEVLGRSTVIGEVSESVYVTLNNLSMGECYNRAGNMHGGMYYDVDDASYEMFYEAMDEYLTQLKKYYDAAKPLLAIQYLKGIILGLYNYENNPLNEMYEVLYETIYTCVDNLISDWNTLYSKNDDNSVSLKAFLKEHCPDWTSIQEELTE